MHWKRAVVYRTFFQSKFVVVSSNMIFVKKYKKKKKWRKWKRRKKQQQNKCESKASNKCLSVNHNWMEHSDGAVYCLTHFYDLSFCHFSILFFYYWLNIMCFISKRFTVSHALRMHAHKYHIVAVWLIFLSSKKLIKFLNFTCNFCHTCVTQ